MRALTYDPAAPQGLALVAVRAVALNFGELAYLAQARQPGEVPGWDAAGTVLRPAADGTGPARGDPGGHLRLGRSMGRAAGRRRGKAVLDLD
jgi:NADPH:quinone reductase-like Zn-dependent oxidoreductase